MFFSLRGLYLVMVFIFNLSNNYNKFVYIRNLLILVIFVMSVYNRISYVFEKLVYIYFGECF